MGEDTGFSLGIVKMYRSSVVVTIIRHCKYTWHHGIVHFQGVKMVNLMLCIFYQTHSHTKAAAWRVPVSWVCVFVSLPRWRLSCGLKETSSPLGQVLHDAPEGQRVWFHNGSEHSCQETRPHRDCFEPQVCFFDTMESSGEGRWRGLPGGELSQKARKQKQTGLWWLPTMVAWPHSPWFRGGTCPSPVLHAQLWGSSCPWIFNSTIPLPLRFLECISSSEDAFRFKPYCLRRNHRSEFLSWPQRLF